MHSQSIFITKVSSSEEKDAVLLLIDSIRSFGGEMGECPFWIFGTDPQVEYLQGLSLDQVEIYSLSVPVLLQHYPFGDKVIACAKAEAQTPLGIHSLIWLDPECLIIQPPLLYDLEEDFDAAFRPVHLRNVGLSPDEPLNAFWKGIYRVLGVQDIQRPVNSFVDQQCLRAYFNSHGFSIRPQLGLMNRWQELFEQLVYDRQYQEIACKERRNQIFLFQALLSALITSALDEQRIRILPPQYNYPYNLQAQIGDARRVGTLNDLVSLTYEERPLDPKLVTDLDIREPLRAWLETHLSTG